MPNFSEPVSFTFIAVSIVLIFIAVGIGIILVKKRARHSELEPKGHTNSESSLNN